MAEERPYRPVYVSAETLAYLLDCSRSTIDKCVKDGLLPKPFRLGGLVRWDFAAVMSHVALNNGVAANTNDPEDEFMKGLRDGTPEKATR